MPKKFVKYAFWGDMSLGILCLLVAAYYGYGENWSCAAWWCASAAVSFVFAVFKPLTRIPGISPKRIVRS